MNKSAVQSRTVWGGAIVSVIGGIVLALHAAQFLPSQYQGILGTLIAVGSAFGGILGTIGIRFSPGLSGAVQTLAKDVIADAPQLLKDVADLKAQVAAMQQPTPPPVPALPAQPVPPAVGGAAAAVLAFLLLCGTASAGLKLPYLHDEGLTYGVKIKMIDFGLGSTGPGNPPYVIVNPGGGACLAEKVSAGPNKSPWEFDLCTQPSIALEGGKVTAATFQVSVDFVALNGFGLSFFWTGYDLLAGGGQKFGKNTIGFSVPYNLTN